MALSTPFSSSWANILPMVKSNAAMYNFILLFLLGGKKIRVFIRLYLMLSKASCCSLPHVNSLSFSSRSNGD